MSACAYYRPDIHYYRKCGIEGINICPAYCGHPASQLESRNWTWPGSVTDREPYGVMCHELGHHVDWLSGEQKHPYWSEYGESVMAESGEAPITSYCPDPAEWFAEMFRLFVTNHALLHRLRRRTHRILSSRWTPISGDDWEAELGPRVPPRILANLRKKVR